MAKLYFVSELIFECLENHIIVGDNKCRVRVPYDGEILGNRMVPIINGCIQDAGTGAGTATVLQLRNVTKGRDYFDTKPEFRVNDKDGNGRALLAQNAILGSAQNFRAGDEIRLDVDDIPGGSDSTILYVSVVCGFWYPYT